MTVTGGNGMLIHEYYLKRGFKLVATEEVPCLCSRWWAMCQADLEWVPAPLVPCHMFSVGQSKMQRWWSWRGISVHLVKVESPKRKVVVFKQHVGMNAMRDWGSEHPFPPYPCAPWEYICSLSDDAELAHEQMIPATGVNRRVIWGYVVELRWGVPVRKEQLKSLRVETQNS